MHNRADVLWLKGLWDRSARRLAGASVAEWVLPQVDAVVQNTVLTVSETVTDPRHRAVLEFPGRATAAVARALFTAPNSPFRDTQNARAVSTDSARTAAMSMIAHSIVLLSGRIPKSDYDKATEVWRNLFGEAFVAVVQYEVSLVRGLLGEVPPVEASVAAFTLKLLGKEGGSADPRILALGVSAGTAELDRMFAELQVRLTSS